MTIPFPRLARFVVGALVAVVLALAACAGSGAREGGLDPSTLAEGERADYAVFAQRCSKCHSLARPLNSGIVDDDYWSMYVARMRRQPASGISTEDARVILRFLHFYSMDQRRKKEASAPLPPADDAGSPPAPVHVLVPVPVPVPLAVPLAPAPADGGS